MPIKKYHKIVMLVALMVYFVTAINSKGYFHYDEHYQIIEFANLKMGINRPSDLAWEYKAQIRPAIQPAFCVVVFKILHAFGITDPYNLALLLRLLTLLLALFAINLFVRSSLNLVETKHRKSYILLSYLLWFLPFINIRFSSETWSGLFFLFAVSILQLNLYKKRGKFIIAGLFLGLSFLCRFQSALLILCLLSWLIIIYKELKQNIYIIIVAILLVVTLGFAIDRWFYGKLVFTSWNYFNVNLLQGVASIFGTLPWNYYFGMILKAPTVPIGSLILVCLCILIYKNPRLLLIWIILPFIFIHSIIPHKEDRFLFPIINFIPLLIVLGCQEIKAIFPNILKSLLYRFLSYLFFGLSALINLLGLFVMALMPVGDGSKAITYFIHKNYSDKPVDLIYGTYLNPYNPLNLLLLKEQFYADKNVREINMFNLIHNMDTIIDRDDRVILFVFNKNNVDKFNFREIILKYNLIPKTQSMPKSVEWINRYYNSESTGSIVLYGNK